MLQNIKKWLKMFITYSTEKIQSFKGTLYIHLGGKNMKPQGVQNYKTYQKA